MVMVSEFTSNIQILKDSKKTYEFDVGTEYACHQIIGNGAYGSVCSATHRSGTKVAIKKISPFQHQLFMVRTIREIRILKHFQHENIVQILSTIDPIKDKFKDIYLVEELMETDLYRVLRTQKLSDEHCQYLLYQVLRGLKCIHSANILHRDLKPSNLLINSNCELKICDFGLARLQTDFDKESQMTEYVATRWYRAPEIMLSLKQYSKAIDVWSVGCILAEMLSNKPLFPGKDYHHQLILILDVLGTPTHDDFESIQSKRARDYVASLPFKPKQPLELLFSNASELAIDMLKKLLIFHPEKRITVEEALAHPYLKAYHDESDEPVTLPMSDVFDVDRFKDELTPDQLSELLYTEVVSYPSRL
eukprot:NODE_135_length_16508_cov_1.365897.p5 type:complete len:363 gc:universal NODE_135_length_16508_cov_1.365897:419-1507(+)